MGNRCWMTVPPCPSCPGSKRFAHPSEKQSIKSNGLSKEKTKSSSDKEAPSSNNDYQRRSRKSAKLTLQTLTPKSLITVPEEVDNSRNQKRPPSSAFSKKQHDNSRN